MGMKDNKPISLCWRGCCNFEFSIGAEPLNIYAGPAEDNCYKISICRNCDEEDEIILFEYRFPLTEEDYDHAYWHSLHDFMIFDDAIDYMMAKRVAKDLFQFWLCSLDMEDYEENSMDSKYTKEWEAYYYQLLHERIEYLTKTDADGTTGKLQGAKI